MAITRHLVLDHLKHRSQEQRIMAVDEIGELLANIPANQANVEEMAWSHQRAEAMQQALHELPNVQRRAILLAYFGGFSQSDIASQLGWPLGTVKKRVRLALQKLRTYLLHWDDIG
jgi:RNA polymerase sigma-70 factor (ECF subfamily)